jgi:hypothetical protein
MVILPTITTNVTETTFLRFPLDTGLLPSDQLQCYLQLKTGGQPFNVSRDTTIATEYVFGFTPAIPGTYRCEVWYSRDVTITVGFEVITETQSFKLYELDVCCLPSVKQTDTVIDRVSVIIDAINAHLANIATDGQRAVMIGNMSIASYPISELMKMLTYYKGLKANEKKRKSKIKVIMS